MMSTQALLPNYYPNSIFSVFSFLGFLSCTVPLPWHLEAWNTGMCLYMVWTGLGCLILFINSIVWYHNAINWAPVWCDITSRYVVGLNVAVPVTCLCIIRRLYYITVFRIPASEIDNRRAITADVMIGIIVPVMAMAFQYIAQGHRFNIYEDIGCWPFTWRTMAATGLVSIPPVLICLVAAVYAVLSVRSFFKNRKDFDEILSNMGHRNLTLSRYIRLLCFSSLGILITIPVAIYAMTVNIHYVPVLPWTGWSDTHEDFQRVDQVPAILWKTDFLDRLQLETSRWFIVASAFVFFFFFSFGEEAIKKYRSALRSVSNNIGLSTGGDDIDGSTSKGPFGTSTPSNSNGCSNIDAKPPSLPPLAVMNTECVIDISSTTIRRISLISPPTCFSDTSHIIEMQPLTKAHVSEVV